MPRTHAPETTADEGDAAAAVVSTLFRLLSRAPAASAAARAGRAEDDYGDEYGDEDEDEDRPGAMNALGHKKRSAAAVAGGSAASSSSAAAKKRKMDNVQKFYAVQVGFRPGVYLTYAECSKQTSGFKGAICECSHGSARRDG